MGGQFIDDVFELSVFSATGNVETLAVGNLFCNESSNKAFYEKIKSWIGIIPENLRTEHGILQSLNSGAHAAPSLSEAMKPTSITKGFQYFFSGISGKGWNDFLDKTYTGSIVRSIKARLEL